MEEAKKIDVPFYRKAWEFKLEQIVGYGETPEEAWEEIRHDKDWLDYMPDGKRSPEHDLPKDPILTAMVDGLIGVREKVIE